MSQEIIVAVKQGKLRGKIAVDQKGGEYYSFQGVPYAKPPLGELRFKAPRPAEPWNGIRDATKEGNVSLSRDLLQQENVVGSEDCLFLNVYTPQLPNKNSKLKPVFVWIHGGGFIFGSGNCDFYGPDYLIPHDVVVVTINYRLGLLGFLNFDDPSVGVPGNAGLKDQVEALRWVQENISNFNGDPNNVTIAGESAGGASIHNLIISPMASGLFHRAIVQSGAATAPWAKAKKSLPAIIKLLNLPESTSAKEVLKILHKMTSLELLELQFKSPDPLEPYVQRLVAPVIEVPCDEPAFMLECPLHLIKSGKFNHVPMMFGYCNNDGILLDLIHMFGFEKFGTITDFETSIPHTLNVPYGSDLSKQIAEKIKNFYFHNEDASQDSNRYAYKLYTDNYFTIDMQYAAKQHAKMSSKPVYFYIFSLESNLNVFKNLSGSKLPGACHADDVCYLFKNRLAPVIRPNSVEEEGIYKTTKMWTNFARNGHPNSIEKDSLLSVHLKPVEQNVIHFVELGENVTTGINPDYSRVKLWDEIYDLVSHGTKN